MALHPFAGRIAARDQTDVGISQCPRLSHKACHWHIQAFIVSQGTAAHKSSYPTPAHQLRTKKLMRQYVENAVGDSWTERLNCATQAAKPRHDSHEIPQALLRAAAISCQRVLHLGWAAAGTKPSNTTISTQQQRTSAFGLRRDAFATHHTISDGVQRIHVALQARIVRDDDNGLVERVSQITEDLHDFEGARAIQ